MKKITLTLAPPVNINSISYFENKRKTKWQEYLEGLVMFW